MVKLNSKLIRRIYGKGLLIFLAGLIFAIFCFIAINAAVNPVSTPQYCGSSCHEMQTAYQSWRLSPHGTNKSGISVNCTYCHLPSKDKYFRHLAAKAYAGAKDMYKHYFGGEYNVEEVRQKVLKNMPNERCKSCHNDLLTNLASPAARTVHTAVLNSSDKPEIKCLKCHENVAHQRQSEMLSP